MVSDALVRNTQVRELTTMPPGLLEATRSGFKDDLYSFLAKPTRLASVVWNTQTAGSVIATVELPADTLNSLTRAKVRGFLGFKATTVLRVQANANKFQGGRLLLVFVPQAGILSTYPGMRIRNLTAATQLPRMEMDISVDTEMMFEIPFISPCPYYNLFSEDNPIGKAYLIVYAPLQLGATVADHVDLTLWAHLKDVELVTPTLTAQMGRPRAVAQNEADTVGGGTISTILSRTAGVASAMKEVPLLSNLAGSASWLTSALSKTAAAFGYSKPTSGDTIMKVFDSGQYFQVNADGVNVAPKFAISSGNCVGVLPGFAGINEDEMSFAHIAPISAFWTSRVWDTSMGPDTSLITHHVEPHSFQVSGTTAAPLSATYFDPSPVAFLSKFFYLWRGSFVITIKIVKTSFHSGRLLFWYWPGQVSGTAASVTDTQYMFREVMDVREKSEWTFTIPYTSTKQYHECADARTPVINRTDPIGQFGINVLNELVMPDTVSDYVTLLIEVAGGPDIEFASPVAPRINPVIDDGWAAQMGDTVQAEAPGSVDCTQCNVGVGSSQISAPSMDPANYCVGEKVLSLLQLLKRFSFMRFLNDRFVAGARSNWDLRPYAVHYIRYDETTFAGGPYGDPYTVFSSCFAYQRGSVRIGWINFTGTVVVQNNAPFICSARMSTDPDILQSGANTFAPMELAYVYDGTQLRPRFADMPPYSENYIRLNRPNSGTNTETVDQFASKVRFKLHQNPNSIDSNTVFMRAVGEDFAFGYFLGTPRLVDIDSIIT